MAFKRKEKRRRKFHVAVRDMCLLLYKLFARMNRTNRTEGVFIKVKPEVKAEIERQRKLGMNLSKVFEKFFQTAFMSKQKLESRKYELESELKLVDNSLEQIREKEKLEATLTLDAGELDILRKTSEFKSSDSQFKAFCLLSKRPDLTRKQFRMILDKYNI